MSEENNKQDKGRIHQGSDSSSPYPVSRLAPAMELVDLAKQITEADTMVNARVTAKIRVIADQITALQEAAKLVLEEAQVDQSLHRAKCNFQKRPGMVYHLYQKGDDDCYFSMVAPSEWRGASPHPFVASYRLENDLSWTPLEETKQPDETQEIVARLLAGLGRMP